MAGQAPRRPRPGLGLRWLVSIVVWPAVNHASKHQPTATAAATVALRDRGAILELSLIPLRCQQYRKACRIVFEIPPPSVSLSLLTALTTTWFDHFSTTTRRWPSGGRPAGPRRRTIWHRYLTRILALESVFITFWRFGLKLVILPL